MVPLMVARAHEYARERGLEAVVTGECSVDEHRPGGGVRESRAAARALAVRDGGRPARGGRRHRATRVPDGYTLATWEGVDHEEMRAAHNRRSSTTTGSARGELDMWRQWVVREPQLPPRAEPGAARRAGCGCGVHPGQRVRRGARGDRQARAFCRRWAPRPSSVAAGWPASCCGSRCIATGRRASTSRRSTSTRRTRPVRWRVYERAGFRTTMRWTDYRLGSEAG